MHGMTLLSFRLFRKLGNLREFFGQMVHRPPGKKNCPYAYEYHLKLTSRMRHGFKCNPLFKGYLDMMMNHFLRFRERSLYKLKLACACHTSDAGSILQPIKKTLSCIVADY